MTKNVDKKNPLILKSYKTINQIVVNPILAASYFLADMYAQNPSDLTSDMLICSFRLESIVNNNQIQGLCPTLTLTDAFEQVGETAYVSCDGRTVSSSDNAINFIRMPQDSIVGTALLPNIPYYFGEKEVSPQPSLVDLKLSQDYVIFDDLTITNTSKSLMLKANLRVDNKGGMVTLMYAADSIINKSINTK